MKDLLQSSATNTANTFQLYYEYNSRNTRVEMEKEKAPNKSLYNININICFN